MSVRCVNAAVFMIWS